MSKQFLNVPVENAKELIERGVAQWSLTAWNNATFTYAHEVILHVVDLQNIVNTPDLDVIYYGTLVVADPSAPVSFKISDGTNEVVIVATNGGEMASFACPGIIFNDINTEPAQGYFYGYKFNITV